MAGYWTVTFTITNGTVADTVVYSVCLSEHKHLLRSRPFSR